MGEPAHRENLQIQRYPTLVGDPALIVNLALKWNMQTQRYLWIWMDLTLVGDFFPVPKMHRHITMLYGVKSTPKILTVMDLDETVQLPREY